jgi:hypothetical protein
MTLMVRAFDPNGGSHPGMVPHPNRKEIVVFRLLVVLMAAIFCSLILIAYFPKLGAPVGQIAGFAVTPILLLGAAFTAFFWKATK